jgi:hypothetical protein
MIPHDLEISPAVPSIRYFRVPFSLLPAERLVSGLAVEPTTEDGQREHGDEQ